MTAEKLTQDGITIEVYRYGFRGGYYAEALDAAGKRLAFTGVYRGKGSKRKAIEAALHQAKTGCSHPDDTGCPG